MDFSSPADFSRVIHTGLHFSLQEILQARHSTNNAQALKEQSLASIQTIIILNYTVNSESESANFHEHFTHRSRRAKQSSVPNIRNQPMKPKQTPTLSFKKPKVRMLRHSAAP